MPLFTSALQLAHLSAPAAPPAGASQLFARSGDLLYTEDSSGAEQLLPTGPTPWRLTSAATTSSTTVGDVVGATLALASGRRYMFRMTGQYSAAAATTGLGLTVNGPTLGAEGLSCNIFLAHTNAIPMLGAITAYNAVVLGTASTAATRMPWEVWGYIHTAAAGNLVLRCRSEVAASLVTIQPGAVGYAWVIG